jgi:hypothetical protein
MNDPVPVLEVDQVTKVYPSEPPVTALRGVSWPHRLRQRWSGRRVVTTAGTLVVNKLRPSDFVRLSSVGLRTRKLRAGLCALGIAIGVAAIVAVLGLSSSAQAGLLNEISQLGTNLLVVQNGQHVMA